MPKYTGNPFRNVLSSRLVLWKVKVSKCGWNGLGTAELKIKVQSYHVPKQKEKPLQNLPKIPPLPQSGRLPIYATIHGAYGLMWKKQEPRLIILLAL